MRLWKVDEKEARAAPQHFKQKHREATGVNGNGAESEATGTGNQQKAKADMATVVTAKHDGHKWLMGGKKKSPAKYGEKNPFAKESFNLTEQARLYKTDINKYNMLKNAVTG